MLFTEKDIDFQRLSPSRFEELCFDLLRQIGFYALVWRQGGADQGRDIEGAYCVTNPLVGSVVEKWQIECKKLAAGVSVEDLASKIAWADAELPRHFAIITSTYVTSGCRQWLERLKQSKPYQIHIIEGKALKALVLNYPELIQRYFANEHDLLLQDLMKQWLRFDLLPNPEHFSLLARNLNPFRLKPEELVFLFCAWQAKESEVDDWLDQELEYEVEEAEKIVDFYERLILVQLENFAVRGISVLSGVKIYSSASSIKSHTVLVDLDLLGQRGDAEKQLQLIELNAQNPGVKRILESLTIIRDQMLLQGLYCYLVLSPEKAIELLLEGGATFSSAIRLIQSGIEADQIDVRSRLRYRS